MQIRVRGAWFLSMLAVAALLAGCGGGSTQTLSIAGSTSVQPLAETLAEAYMAQTPDVMVDVQGGGSSVGVTSAGEGTADIGNASRNIKDEEFMQFPDLQVFTIAYDGIAVVVNPSVELEGLSVEQVRDIFAGTITNFSEVGGSDVFITVVSREEGSGTRGAFEELVMGEEALITETAILQQSNGAVRTAVAATDTAIGYLSFGYVDEGVTAVPIDGVEATVENVIDGTYILFRPFNMVTNGGPGELAQGFLDFVLSADGQSIVEDQGFIRVDQ